MPDWSGRKNRLVLFAVMVNAADIKAMLTLLDKKLKPPFVSCGTLTVTVKPPTPLTTRLVFCVMLAILVGEAEKAGVPSDDGREQRVGGSVDHAGVRVECDPVEI